MFRFPQSHSQAPPSLHLLRGLSPVELIFSLSQGGGGTGLRCFDFGFTTLHFKQYHWQLWVFLMAEPFLSHFVSCPWKIQQELLKINHMTIRRQSLDFVSCIAVGYTCNSADKCIFLNHCFYLKSLRLAPNFCWRYTMGYLNIFMHTQKHNTRTTEKIP